MPIYPSLVVEFSPSFEIVVFCVFFNKLNFLIRASKCKQSLEQLILNQNTVLHVWRKQHDTKEKWRIYNYPLDVFANISS